MKKLLSDDLPYWLDKNLLAFHASLREEVLSDEDKFVHFRNRDIKNLISPSIHEDEIRNTEHKRHRKRLNKLLFDFAILTLNNKGFIDEVLELANITGLLKIRYRYYYPDFHLTHSPLIGAWNSRLQHLSLMFLSEKINKGTKPYDIEKLFIESYLPPKFDDKLLTLMRKYGLEFLWYESIVHLLLTGHWYLPRNASVIFLNLESINKNVGPTISNIALGIYSMTSKEEIHYRWREIDSLKKQLFPSLKSRQKPKDLKELILKFNNEEKFKDLLGVKDIRKRNALNRKVRRIEDSHKKFLETHKKIPKDIMLQILRLQDTSLMQIHFY